MDNRILTLMICGGIMLLMYITILALNLADLFAGIRKAEGDNTCCGEKTQIRGHRAHKVYNDNGETEYNDKESAVIEGLLQTLPTKWAIALQDIIIKE